MPLYEYECGACHRRTEKIQKFSDPELTLCPFCSGPLARTVTAPAIQFKGAGWYKDLYSSAKPTPSGTPAEGASGAPAGGSEAPAAGKNETSATPVAATPAPAAASPSSTSNP